MSYSLYSPSRDQYLTRSLRSPISGIRPYESFSSAAETYPTEHAAREAIRSLGLVDSTDATDPLAAYVVHTFGGQ